MYRVLTQYFFICGVLFHIGFAASFSIARYYLNEPLSSVSKRIGIKLINEGYGIRKNIGGLILRYGSYFEPSEIKFTLPPISEWEGHGANKTKYYSDQEFTEYGLPVISQRAYSSPYTDHTIISVKTADELLSAIKSATSGNIITLEPGLYRLNGRNIPIINPGHFDTPIVVRSPILGDAIIELSMLEGFHVKAPFWVFENLIINGTCNDDSYCEHAFHIVGSGHSFVLRNSIVRDFNAHIKVNASGNNFPDNGLIENSTFYNTRPRETASPVNMLNIDSVNNWRVKGNLLADFSKNKGDRISYAAYMKGNGRNGIFEQNLVICEANVDANSSTQVGLSFGGGGTATAFCRNSQCLSEHTNGIIRNNIILNCPNDVGIYLNKSTNTQVYNNAIVNSLGIDVRFESSTASIVNNIISGRISDRDGGVSFRENNLIDIDCTQPGSPYPFSCRFEEWYISPYQADFSLNNGDELLTKGVFIEEFGQDFCGNRPNTHTIDIGPIQYSSGKSCSPFIIK